MSRTPTKFVTAQAQQAQGQTKARQEIATELKSTSHKVAQEESERNLYYYDQSRLIDTMKRQHLARLEQERDKRSGQWKASLEQQQRELAQNLETTGAYKLWRDITGHTAREREQQANIERTLKLAEQRRQEERQAIERQYQARQNLLKAQYGPDKARQQAESIHKQSHEKNRHESLNANRLSQNLQRSPANDSIQPEQKMAVEQDNKRSLSQEFSAASDGDREAARQKYIQEKKAAFAQASQRQSQTRTHDT